MTDSDSAEGKVTGQKNRLKKEINMASEGWLFPRIQSVNKVEGCVRDFPGMRRLLSTPFLSFLMFSVLFLSLCGLHRGHVGAS